MKQKDNISQIEMMPFEKCEWDIFVSYRRDVFCKEDYFGCAVARQFVQQLTECGYKVFYDCDIIPYPETEAALSAMQRAKLVIIIVADFFFDNIDSAEGFLEELEVARKLYAQEQNKNRFLLLNLNKKYDKERLKGTCYEWLKGVHYEIFWANKEFASSFNTIVTKIESLQVKPSLPTQNEMLEKERLSRKRWITALLFVIAVLLGVFCFYNKYVRLTFAGGGTVKNFLLHEKHIDVDKYAYWPSPSSSAAIQLIKCASSDDWKYVPIVLSAEKYWAKDLRKFIVGTDTTSGGDTSKSDIHILELLVGYADLKVLIYPPVDGYNNTISVSRLEKLILDRVNRKETLLATTSRTSGTFHAFCDFLPELPRIMDSIDNAAWTEFDESGWADLKSTKNKRRKMSLIAFENDYYNLNPGTDEPVTLLTLLNDVSGKAQDTCRVPLFIYTVLDKDLSLSPLQKRFLKKFGYVYNKSNRPSNDLIISDTIEAVKYKDSHVLIISDTIETVR